MRTVPIVPPTAPPPRGNVSLALLALLALLAPGCRAASARDGGFRAVPRFEVPAAASGAWYKGNTHSHSNLTDGDAPPDTVIGWYRRHGYRWLVLSDHDTLVSPASFPHLQDSAFVLVPGNEVTGRWGTPPAATPVHVTAINVARVARRVTTDSTVFGTLQRNVDAVREAGGVPLVNHPNFGWALGVEDLARVRRVALFEVWNGHPLVNNLGGGGAPGTEALWDSVLTRGRRLYGVATDDSHHFLGEFAPHQANPGRAWVVVRAPRLEPAALVGALEAGHFYASTGVELADVAVTDTTLTVRIRPKRSSRYRTWFIGTGGRVLGESIDTVATLTLGPGTRFAPGARYVRAKVVESNGAMAWVQPVFVR